METRKFRKIWDNLGPYQKHFLIKEAKKRKQDIGGMLDDCPELIQQAKERPKEWPEY